MAEKDESWWTRRKNSINDFLGALPAAGTELGNLISGTPIGTAVEEAGGFVERNAPNIINRVGTGFGNMINDPNQRNPFGFLEPIVNSPFGGAVAGGANAAQNFLPFRPMARGIQDLRSGNNTGFWGNLIQSGFTVAPLGGVIPQVRAGTMTTKKLLPWMYKNDKLNTAFLGAGLTAGTVGALRGPAAGPAAAAPSLRAPFISADAAERRAQAAQGPKIFQTADAMERRVINQDLQNKAAPDYSAFTGVGGPTGDEMAEYEMYLRQAQEDYERRMADLSEARAMAEEDYRLGTRRSRRGTAGRSANLSGLLAAMGLDLSPAAAEGGLQYEAQRGARELAGLEKGRMQTRTGASRAEAEADAERKRRIAQLNQYLMTAPAARAGNAPPPSA